MLTATVSNQMRMILEIQSKYLRFQILVDTPFNFLFIWIQQFCDDVLNKKLFELAFKAVSHGLRFIAPNAFNSNENVPR